MFSSENTALKRFMAYSPPALKAAMEKEGSKCSNSKVYTCMKKVKNH